MRLGKTGGGSTLAIVGGALANAASAQKDLGLQQCFLLAGFALHVIDRTFVLDVGVEAKNHEIFPPWG